MKSTAILDLMVKDHNRLMEYLKDVENNLGRDFGFLSNSFNTFQWNLEKHFFVEERAIFISYNPRESVKEYSFFSDLRDQHTDILDIIESLRKKLQNREPFDLDKLKKLLIKHKTFEEKSIYPVIDQEIEEGEKVFIIDRIKDIRL
ncbi:MAG: hemerythrin domain-containing protein [Candidatus Hodarchaeales archaeon]|jgi:iron-sulfur cluster repair protein YtfE (RIC family)